VQETKGTKTMVMAKARWLDNNLLFPFSFSFFRIVLCFSVSPGSVSLRLCSLFFLFLPLGLERVAGQE
jgi:hypothetical protein